MAAAVNGRGPSFEVGAITPLFQLPVGLVGGGYPYDVSAEGQRFLVRADTVREQMESTPITVVLNWTAALPK
jgi:hypothetical protein